MKRRTLWRSTCLIVRVYVSETYRPTVFPQPSQLVGVLGDTALALRNAPIHVIPNNIGYTVLTYIFTVTVRKRTTRSFGSSGAPPQQYARLYSLLSMSPRAYMGLVTLAWGGQTWSQPRGRHLWRGDIGTPIFAGERSPRESSTH